MRVNAVVDEILQQIFCCTQQFMLLSRRKLGERQIVQSLDIWPLIFVGPEIVQSSLNLRQDIGAKGRGLALVQIHFVERPEDDLEFSTTMLPIPIDLFECNERCHGATSSRS